MSVAAFVLAVPASAGAKASPAPQTNPRAPKPVVVACGQTITRDTRLANDLANCAGNGLYIGADSITLDLNGHTIDGDEVGFDSCDTVTDCDAGVDNRAGHPGVTVMGGSVTEFVDGVSMHRAPRSIVHDVSTTHLAHANTFLDQSNGVLVRHNRSVDDGGLVDIVESSNVRVDANYVSGSEFAGIGLFGSDHVQVTGNSVFDSGISAIAVLENSDHNRIAGNSITRGADGVYIAEAGDHNVVSGNTLTRTQFQSIFLDIGSAHNTVAANSLTGNGDGIIVASDDNKIADNDLARIRGVDGDPVSGVGVFVDIGADRNLIAGNAIANTAAYGIRVTSTDEALGTPQDNVVRGNRVQRATLDGYRIDETAAGTLLDANAANANGADGINVLSATTRLTANIANRNGALGIEAVPGVTDGGGNRAMGNGNPLQCTNVLCRP